MRTDTVLFVIVVIAAIAAIFFGMKPKVCIDNTSGNARTTHRLFPCGANETAVVA